MCGDGLSGFKFTYIEQFRNIYLFYRQMLIKWSKVQKKKKEKKKEENYVISVRVISDSPFSS